MQCNVNCGCSYLVGVFKGTKKKVVPPPPPSPAPVPPTPAREPDRIEWVTKRYDIPCAEVTYEVKKVNGIETGEMRNTKNITSDTYEAVKTYDWSHGTTRKITTFKRWYVNGAQVCVENLGQRTEHKRNITDSRDHTSNDPNKSNNS